MPKTSSKSTKSTASRSNRSKTTGKKATPSPVRKPSGSTRARASRKKSAPAASLGFGSLSLDRKLDILGVFMVLFGFLILLSYVSSEQGALFKFILNAFRLTAGWGAVLIPIALVLIGLWLIFRKIERLPLLSTERLFGIVLLYLNLLAWLHFFAGSSLEAAKAGNGGGFCRRFFHPHADQHLGRSGRADRYGRLVGDRHGLYLRPFHSGDLPALADGL